MKRGQVWVETVIYTLIGLVLIGIVLAFVTPKLGEFRDKSVIEQTISSLNSIDSKINEILLAPGNTRVVEFKLSRGEIFFNAPENKIRFELSDSKILFSEPEVTTSIGRINVTTIEGNDEHRVILEIGYRSDIQFNGNNTREIKFSAASTPYKFSFENRGLNQQGMEIINVREIS